MTPGNKEVAVTVINGNWGLTSLSAVRAVLLSAFGVLVRSFDAAPEAAVHVSRWNRDYPFTVYDKRPYQVFLSARDTYWSQYVYQFSHELCHILTHFDTSKKHRHKWFEESLCELASLHVLRSLATVWKEDPPSEVYEASAFAKHHLSYAEEVERKTPIPPQSDLPAWLHRNIDLLEDDPTRRELNRVVAVSLSADFRQTAALWRDCRWLNRWDVRKDGTFSEYLNSWTDCLREHGRKQEPRAPEVVRQLFAVYSE